jgi:hypothetical protein
MALACPECGFELKPYFRESTEYRPCHVCGRETSVWSYPACFLPAQAITAADLRRDEEDAACFYHESRKAVQVCSQCGRFVCALCAAQIGNDVLCPSCLVPGERRPGARGSADRLERERTLYDSIALMVAIVPALTVWLSIVGGPAAVYIVLRYWKRPAGLVRRYRWRKWLALGLGLAQTGGWVWLFTYMALQRRVTS